MLDLKWAPLVGATVMSSRTFNSLKPETRQAVMVAAQEAGKRITLESRKNSEDAIRIMQEKHGLKVTPLTPEAEAAWRAACEEAYPKIRGTIVPAETFDRVVRLLDEYRKAHPQGDK
jgi:TRAP-type C4-dicarboxylate transport system substrate-binding protein